MWILAKKKDLTVRELAALGGKARAKAMTKQERSASAQKAAVARWSKKAVKKKEPEK